MPAPGGMNCPYGATLCCDPGAAVGKCGDILGGDIDAPGYVVGGTGGGDLAWDAAVEDGTDDVGEDFGSVDKRSISCLSFSRSLSSWSDEPLDFSRSI